VCDPKEHPGIAFANVGLLAKHVAAEQGDHGEWVARPFIRAGTTT
jgi:hypothetical protein